MRKKGGRVRRYGRVGRRLAPAGVSPLHPATSSQPPRHVCCWVLPRHLQAQQQPGKHVVAVPATWHACAVGLVDRVLNGKPLQLASTLTRLPFLLTMPPSEYSAAPPAYFIFLLPLPLSRHCSIMLRPFSVCWDGSCLFRTGGLGSFPLWRGPAAKWLLSCYSQSVYILRGWHSRLLQGRA